MNRVIKFRGLSRLTKEWLIGDLFQHRQTGDYVLPDNIEGEDMNLFNVFTETIGQFTNVYDSDGKEVYEGDIVDCWSEGRHCTCGVVKFGSAGFFIHVMYKGKPSSIWHLSPSQFTGRDEGLHVIGNIYDNPELLKGGNNE